MLMAASNPGRATVNNQDEQFFKALGSRIASARKAQNRTQQQIADLLGIAQQTYAQYEVGRSRIPASMLPILAQDLSVTLDELMGQNERLRSKPGPTPKLLKQIERISQLPKAKQQVLMEMLDGVLAQTGH
jgi:transcriptional regulator with XRE-family HTH domain